MVAFVVLLDVSREVLIPQATNSNLLMANRWLGACEGALGFTAVLTCQSPARMPISGKRKRDPWYPVRWFLSDIENCSTKGTEMIHGW